MDEYIDFDEFFEPDELYECEETENADESKRNRLYRRRQKTVKNDIRLRHIRCGRHSFWGHIGYLKLAENNDLPKDIPYGHHNRWNEVGYLSGAFDGSTLLHTGVYIQYPRSRGCPSRRRKIKRASGKCIRKADLSGEGGRYRRVYNYWCSLY